MPTPNTTDLKKFAAAARRQLREQVAGRLEQVLRTDSAELRERESALKELREQIAQTSKKEVIDRAAYTWFNRFCALRFMDVNRYTRLGLVSPAEGLSQPEVLQEAKQGYIDEDLGRFVQPKRVFDLLNGQRPSSDPQGEAYRLLLVAACNYYREIMPFMFEKIADYTELLMPLDLLSEHSVLHGLREALTPEACQDVEVIGWLYQYYIAERKDEVFEVLKQNQKIEAGDIPAATQLFTPHWIVRYLVENSLGRLWMQNRPGSRLRERMEYYIANDELGIRNSEGDTPVIPNSQFLVVNSPEDIKLADPACGSGHMLTYAFDLLYAIYEEEGYPAADIPRLILEKNLYGIEIDGRAGALAAFALFMKARAKDRRWFTRPAQPQICVLENVTFTDQELDEYLKAVDGGQFGVGSDLFTNNLRETLRQFEQAENFGSLIRPMLGDAAFARGMLESKEPGLFLHHVHEKALKVLRFAEFLSPRYHVVVANPPYMSDAGMNDEIKKFTKNHFPSSKADTYAMFIERNLEIAVQNGFVGMITIPNWMYLSSFEDLRKKIISENIISSLVHNGRGVWGPDFGSCSFVLIKSQDETYQGTFKKLFKEQGKVYSNSALMMNFHDVSAFPEYKISSTEIKKIPGYPIAYWVSKQFLKIFSIDGDVGRYADLRQGMATSDVGRFLRLWHEVSHNNMGLGCENAEDAKKTGKRWFPTNKGGGYRKWYGNNDYLVNWYNDGEDVLAYAANLYGSPTRTIKNISYYFRPSVTWGMVTSSVFSARYSPGGFLFDVGGPSAFSKPEYLFPICGLFNSSVFQKLIMVISPTLNFNSGDIAKIPLNLEILTGKSDSKLVKDIVSCHKEDWDSYETSWDFTFHPFLQTGQLNKTIDVVYQTIREHWREMVNEMLKLEEKNNQIFIDAYEMPSELSPKVHPKEITLTCNPRYRYGGVRSDEELEALLRADTMKEFISYAVGCMFGRYSLEKPGLVLANQGETIDDFRLKIADCGVPWNEVPFKPDEDNVIPVLEGEWFSDDVTERFKKFLRVTFGNEHYDENLAFIEAAIGRDIRGYFVKEFYKEHVSMYKKRPIYWMFSSPKGSFQALIYMHRYKPDTLSVVLRYLRDFREKLTARKAYQEQLSISASATAREKTAALKEIEKLNATLEELRAYERETLYPLATQRVEIDLDDGVKVNYPKFGSALVKIPGL